MIEKTANEQKLSKTEILLQEKLMNAKVFKRHFKVIDPEL